MPEKLQITIRNIEGVKLSTKTKVEGESVRKLVVVSFECNLPPKDMARIYNLDRQGQPMDVIIESPQAEFDLKVERLSLETGQLTPV